MPQLLLTDEICSKLRKILLQESICDKRDLRMTVEGMLYRMRTGCPWRVYPPSSEAGVRFTSALTPGQQQASGSGSSKRWWLSQTWS